MGAMGKGRLNFVIPEQTDRRLDVYCERTTRTPADVIRQLVSEWIEGDRKLKRKATVHPTGKRTNVPFGYATLASLDERVRAEAHTTVSAVITALLEDFLAHRADPSVEETITVHVPLPVSIHTLLAAQCQHTGTNISERLALEASTIATKLRSTGTTPPAQRIVQSKGVK